MEATAINFRSCGLVALLTLASGFASAAVVTTPAGTIVSSTPNPGVGDPVQPDTWVRLNVRSGSTIGITNNFPRNGNGSGFLSLSDAGGKADWTYVPSQPLGTLDQFISGTYDWYRDALSSVPSHLHPVYRLIIDIDGNPGTSDIAYLVYERVYQPGPPATPTGTWVSETITPNTNMWVSQQGVGNEEVFGRPLSAYMTGSYTPTPGWTQITGNSRILGIQVGIGSGWNGTYRGATDNIGVTADSTVGPDNFELDAPPPPTPVVTAVPTSDMWALIGLGSLLGGLGAWQRRKKAPKHQS